MLFTIPIALGEGWLLIRKLVLCGLLLFGQHAFGSQNTQQNQMFELESCPRYFVLVHGTFCVLQAAYPMSSLLGSQVMLTGDQAAKQDQHSLGNAWRQLPYVEELDHGLALKEINLGRRLFFDRELSYDKKTSCADCHQPDLAFTDGRAVSVTGGGIAQQRNAPTLLNVVFNRRYFWDGRALSLEDQLRGPLFSPKEMGLTETELQNRLQSDPMYRRKFADIYPESNGKIETRHVLHVLATFEKTLISLGSRYDRYVAGDQGALTGAEQRGFNIFRSFVTRCAECHIPPLFTSGQLVVIGAPDRPEFNDEGAGGWMHEPTLNKAFRVPTLRNIAKTAPYMHSGVFKTLDDVVQFYDRGGGRRLGAQTPTGLHWHIRPMGLAASEKRDLVLFLRSLNEEPE